MRHSFGSYFLGKTKDENLTASEMGNSPEVIIQHYWALVREADVTRHWHLAPENVQGDRPRRRSQCKLWPILKHVSSPAWYCKRWFQEARGS